MLRSVTPLQLGITAGTQSLSVSSVCVWGGHAENVEQALENRFFIFNDVVEKAKRVEGCDTAEVSGD